MLEIPSCIDIVARAAARGLAVRPLADAESDWRGVLLAGAPHTTEYLPSFIRYFTAYSREAHPGSQDLSITLYYDGRPAGIWPLALLRSDEGFRCGSNMGAVLPPAFRPDLPPGVLKRLERAAFALVNDLCRFAGQPSWKGRTLTDACGVSDWYRCIMAAGATVAVAHDLWCDLSPPPEMLWSGLRKRFRPLINKARRLWRAETIHALRGEVLEEVRGFHLAVAGRQTRSAAVWQAQANSVNQGEGFAVLLRNDVGRLVGAGIFHCSHRTASYATGIYDRNLFDLPVGHLVQMLAIEEMKRRDLAWYQIGRRSYAGEAAHPNAKEQSIGLFKEGFASETRLLLETDCAIGASAA